MRMYHVDKNEYTGFGCFVIAENPEEASAIYENRYGNPLETIEEVCPDTSQPFVTELLVM